MAKNDNKMASDDYHYYVDEIQAILSAYTDEEIKRISVQTPNFDASLLVSSDPPSHQVSNASTPNGMRPVEEEEYDTGSEIEQLDSLNFLEDEPDIENEIAKPVVVKYSESDSTQEPRRAARDASATLFSLPKARSRGNFVSHSDNTPDILSENRPVMLPSFPQHIDRDHSSDANLSSKSEFSQPNRKDTRLFLEHELAVLDSIGKFNSLGPIESETANEKRVKRKPVLAHSDENIDTSNSDYKGVDFKAKIKDMLQIDAMGVPPSMRQAKSVKQSSKQSMEQPLADSLPVPSRNSSTGFSRRFKGIDLKKLNPLRKSTEHKQAIRTVRPDELTSSNLTSSEGPAKNNSFKLKKNPFAFKQERKAGDSDSKLSSELLLSSIPAASSKDLDGAFNIIPDSTDIVPNDAKAKKIVQRKPLKTSTSNSMNLFPSQSVTAQEQQPESSLATSRDIPDSYYSAPISISMPSSVSPSLDAPSDRSNASLSTPPLSSSGSTEKIPENMLRISSASEKSTNSAPGFNSSDINGFPLSAASKSTLLSFGLNSTSTELVPPSDSSTLPRETIRQIQNMSDNEYSENSESKCKFITPELVQSIKTPNTELEKDEVVGLTGLSTAGSRVDEREAELPLIVESMKQKLVVEKPFIEQSMTESADDKQIDEINMGAFEMQKGKEVLKQEQLIEKIGSVRDSNETEQTTLVEGQDNDSVTTKKRRSSLPSQWKPEKLEDIEPVKLERDGSCDADSDSQHMSKFQSEPDLVAAIPPRVQSLTKQNESTQVQSPDMPLSSSNPYYGYPLKSMMMPHMNHPASNIPYGRGRARGQMPMSRGAPPMIRGRGVPRGWSISRGVPVGRGYATSRMTPVPNRGRMSPIPTGRMSPASTGRMSPSPMSMGYNGEMHPGLSARRPSLSSQPAGPGAGPYRPGTALGQRRAMTPSPAMYSTPQFSGSNSRPMSPMLQSDDFYDDMIPVHPHMQMPPRFRQNPRFSQNNGPQTSGVMPAYKMSDIPVLPMDMLSGAAADRRDSSRANSISSRTERSWTGSFSRKGSRDMTNDNGYFDDDDDGISVPVGLSSIDFGGRPGMRAPASSMNMMMKSGTRTPNAGYEKQRRAVEQSEYIEGDWDGNRMVPELGHSNERTLSLTSNMSSYSFNGGLRRPSANNDDGLSTMGSDFDPSSLLGPGRYPRLA
ncbi:hypothetical protein V1511DRAFT_368136 [Dipodascopsis uninucleata]